MVECLPIRKVKVATAANSIFHLHTGARKGAPDAVQVADRFHIQKNLGEVVERIFHRHREALQQIVGAGTASSSTAASVPIARPEREA